MLRNGELVEKQSAIRALATTKQPGAEALLDDMEEGERPPFAPPYLCVEGQRIAQVANILHWLTERHDLAPVGDRVWLNQLQLTISDMVAEVHNVHHPVATGAYYHEQKPEAARAAAAIADPAACAADPEGSQRLNVEMPRHLATLAAATSVTEIPLIFTFTPLRL